MPPSERLERKGWRFRSTPGFRSQRANSVLPIGSPDDVAPLVAAGEQFYRERGVAPLFQVSEASAPPSLAEHLRRRGYTAGKPTLVMHANIDHVVVHRPPGRRWSVRVDTVVTDRWFDALWSVLSTRPQQPCAAQVLREALLRPPHPSFYVAVEDAGEVWAVGQSVVERGWAGVQCLVTVSGHRRQGAASAVLRHLAAESAAAGAMAMYLAVNADNAPARALYATCGFGVAHRYRYFAPQPLQPGRTSPDS